MLRDLSARRAVGLLVCTIVVALAAGSATASAGQALCIGPAGSGVTVPDSDGTCRMKNATLKTLVEQSELDAEKAKVAALQDKLSKVSYDETGVNGKPTLQISGANLQIVSGSGTTGGVVKGVGNLFIGYNEHPTERPQTGSHNLIIGPGHSFTSFGGLLAGYQNVLTGPYASVSGGLENTASGLYSSVSGGFRNTASGNSSSVSGGRGNTASNFYSSVSGGLANTASGSDSSVSGGGGNTASKFLSSVSGGHRNTASGQYSSILGGRDITLTTEWGTSP